MPVLHALRRRIGIIMLCGLLVSPGPLCALDLRRPQELGAQHGFLLAIKQQQRVVVTPNQEIATTILAVIKAPLGTVASAIRTHARDRYGEREWHEGSRSDGEYWANEYGHFADQERDRRLQSLAAAGVRVDRYREIILRSSEYNVWKVLGWTRGSSRLTVRLLDGQAILGVPTALVWLQRRDEVYAWGWTMHMLIPAFFRQGALFVSEDELTFVSEAARSVGEPYAMYAERNFSHSLLDSSSILLSMAEWLRDQPRQDR
jgi:hypothetical protein